MTGALLIGAIEAFLYYRFFTREEAEPVKGKRGGRTGKVLKFEAAPPLGPASVEQKKLQ